MIDYGKVRLRLLRKADTFAEAGGEVAGGIRPAAAGRDPEAGGGSWVARGGRGAPACISESWRCSL